MVDVTKITFVQGSSDPALSAPPQGRCPAPCAQGELGTSTFRDRFWFARYRCGSQQPESISMEIVRRRSSTRIRSLYKKSPPQRELVDVNGIIEEMFTLLKGEANRYSVAMRTELATDPPKIMADRVQLQQVFMNLMLNAIEAMKNSGGELIAKSQLQDGQPLFSVSDTGPGLPSGNVDQIFSAFFTTKLQGSGMGLAISRSIVESHGGRLWATANDGHGATFHFSLPTEVTESAFAI